MIESNGRQESTIRCLEIIRAVAQATPLEAARRYVSLPLGRTVTILYCVLHCTE